MDESELNDEWKDDEEIESPRDKIALGHKMKILRFRKAVATSEQS